MVVFFFRDAKLIKSPMFGKCQCAVDLRSRGKGSVVRGAGGLVCNLASPARLAGGGNLGGLISPELAVQLHPPADCKHNGSPWYRADCSFIRAKKWSRPGESGSVSLSLSDELVYFSSSRRAREALRTELIGERCVHRRGALESSSSRQPDSRRHAKNQFSKK